MPTPKPNVILLLGRFPERIDGTLIKDIPLCDPNHPGNWMGWTKEKLIESGYSASCPVIHDAWKAKYEEWKSALDQETIGENTIVVGLSAGGYALLRYLGESGKKVKNVVLVAPGSRMVFDADDDRERLPFEKEFYDYDVTQKLRDQIKNGTVAFVSNDMDSIIASVDFYRRTLDARVIELEGRGHFSFLIPEFPELLEEIKKM